MIPLEVNKQQREKNARRCRERNILLPTFEEMKDPQTISPSIKKEVEAIGLWDIHPRNLYRITWANEPTSNGGRYGDINYMVLPPELTGVDAKIVALAGKWFPTGAHKVGATYGCLTPALITGQFDPLSMKAVWPSTGNYCRGGAYVAALLACESIAILPEEMSQERFQWLAKVAGEVVATPGCESNVKEIFDKCWELKKTRDDVRIFNQFDEFGNHLWHYEVTGDAMQKVLRSVMGEKDRYSGVVLTSGSAGTLGCGDKMKEVYPSSNIAVGEALQCPTLLLNGFGGHRIEGIGDKHVPWIHNVRNTDMVIAVDDNHTIRLIRLFNEPVGRKLLEEEGVDPELTNQLDILGISSVGNLVSAIKYAKYYELTENDVVLTVFTDSMELYGSRIKELEEKYGPYTEKDAARDYELLQQIGRGDMQELSYYDKKRIHNLKYYTWIEQQGRALDELNAQWYDHQNYWGRIHECTSEIDALIKEFNEIITGGA
jgi:cysteine synthase